MVKTRLETKGASSSPLARKTMAHRYPDRFSMADNLQLTTTAKSAPLHGSNLTIWCGASRAESPQAT
jgi:hypothetical protein